ncbi:unnamed protein product [Dibothriocephalus latus]|uniref:Uncharacterized protein n=1 Tax=Dibothriocephalus latus TaxID=60516 RepID=A0A3P7NI03_DIBLA|nr:unnamed protein product [Dibothriocephalus latus]
MRTLGLKDISNNQTEPSEEVLNRAATIIQASYRGYHVRHELHKHDDAEHHVHHKEAVVSPEPDEAAKKIQAAFRGYRVRKQYRSQTTPISPVFFDPEDAKYIAAATKIQASYRGYRTRKTSNFHRSSAASKK